jgi:hypothetical protein
MSKLRPIGERLVALFILGAVLFNPPFLSIFNRAAHLFGIPLLYVYLFFAWVFLITLSAVVVERAEEEDGECVRPRHASDQLDDAPSADD